MITLKEMQKTRERIALKPIASVKIEKPLVQNIENFFDEKVDSENVWFDTTEKMVMSWNPKEIVPLESISNEFAKHLLSMDSRFEIFQMSPRDSIAFEISKEKNSHHQKFAIDRT